jgi:hypothetical protein
MMRGECGRALFLAAVLLSALAVTLSGQASRLPSAAAQAALAGWRADFDGDGAVDFCQIDSRPGYSGVTCTLTRSRQPIRSGNIDLGYPEGRAFVDFDGDRKQDYCRVVGTAATSFVWCTLSDGTAFGPTVRSPALDWGYPETRQWRDVNGDGRADFCRTVGNNRELFSCTLSEGRRGFGRTVNSRR